MQDFKNPNKTWVWAADVFVLPFEVANQASFSPWNLLYQAYTKFHKFSWFLATPITERLDYKGLLNQVEMGHLENSFPYQSIFWNVTLLAAKMIYRLEVNWVEPILLKCVEMSFATDLSNGAL